MNVSIMNMMMKFMTFFDETLVYSLLSIVVVYGQRYCYECTGFQCMQNPLNPELFPGRVKCHEVMEFCSTHVRYEPFLKNTTGSVSKVMRKMKATDYAPTSATRSCAKVWLGNTCRRDYLGPPLITCMSTCDTDFCNCDTRSPPAEMFPSGKVLHLAPKGAKYGPQDLLSCGHMAGTRQRSIRIDDDYNYYNDYETKRRRTNKRKKSGHKRRKSRRNSSSTLNRMLQFVHLFSGLLSVSAVHRQF